MSYSKGLGPPLVSASVTTVVVANFYIVRTLADGNLDPVAVFRAIWPVALTATVAIVLVMSLLYNSLLEMMVEMEEREKSAIALGMRDPLTGLANRAFLESRLTEAIGRFRRNAENFALLMLDLDHFKKVNDVLGHQTGDALLKEVAVRLLEHTREIDTVARIGGDEFVIIQTGIGSLDDVQQLSDRLLRSLASPYNLEGREVSIGASIGFVLASQSNLDPTEFMRRADIALYRAKDGGRNRSKFFSDSMDAEVRRRVGIENSLRQALPSGEGLEVHYQPQLDISGQIRGVEALLRWKHPVYGNLQPSEVVPIAEEMGLIQELGEFVFRQACQAAALFPNLFVAVNVSPLQFGPLNLLSDSFKTIAKNSGVACEQFEIEITENVFIKQGNDCEHNISALRTAGFRIALDDFGTGYSSLSYLRRFKVDKIKLDKSFIDMKNVQGSVAIIRGVVTLAHSLGLEVIAEGVESAEQEQLVLEAGCDGLQGFRFGKAGPMEQLRHLLGSCRAAA